MAIRIEFDRKRITARVEKAIGRVEKKISGEVFKQVLRNTPQKGTTKNYYKRTGTLRDGWKITRSKGVSTFTNETDYAAYYEYGTRNQVGHYTVQKALETKSLEMGFRYAIS